MIENFHGENLYIQIKKDTENDESDCNKKAIFQLTAKMLTLN